MSASNITANRKSTPEASNSLRPPAARALAASTGHHLRSSADMSGFASSPLSGQAIRPSSEVYYNPAQRAAAASRDNPSGDDPMDKAAQQWIADIEQNETTLEEMAAATLDQDFKDELSAIEQWFKVLSEAERTAALYALLQQTTQVQIRFFIQVLQEMAKSHPMSGILSPSTYGDKGNRISDATGKLGVEGTRNSMGRPPPSPGAKRNSVLDQSVINAMFPDAANAIAKKKAEYTQQTGNAPSSNRNSTALGGDRNSLAAPSISTPADAKENDRGGAPPTPWGQRPIERPKSSSSGAQQGAPPQQTPSQQPPMGHFSQPAPSASLRSPRPPQLNQGSLHAAGEKSATSGAPEMPLLSPYGPTGSWASMTNTPMVANFPQQGGHPPAQGAPGGGPQTQTDMLANATAMKLAALSTVNNRIMLDDVRKYRRARSNDSGAAAATGGLPGMSPGLPPGANVLVVNESGQLVNSVNASQLAALQLQQQQAAAVAAAAGRRSPRPHSPGVGMGGANPGLGGFMSPQNNGYLAAYDHSAGLTGGLGGLSLGGGGGGGGPFGHHHSGSHGEGYISDHSDLARGRSPRGRRGTSKPPEDPLDMALLRDIPAWLRSLRLHKYTDQLKDLRWEDLVQLDDKGLEERGVNALGARRKMLKVFEQVREAKSDGKLAQ